MELARAESQPMEQEETDFSQIVMDAVDETWEAAQAGRVYLMADLPDSAFPVLGDHALLVCALAHLLSNAVRHSPPGSRVECSLALTVIAGVSFFRCAVIDHGPGIADADQDRLFQSFSRIGHAQEMLAHPGAGLGLAFVQTVARRHGGFADVISTAGAGASFGLALPVHRTG